MSFTTVAPAPLAPYALVQSRVTTILATHVISTDPAGFVTCLGDDCYWSGSSAMAHAEHLTVLVMTLLGFPTVPAAVAAPVTDPYFGPDSINWR